MRHHLEAQRTGQDVEQVANAWADPEEAAKEVSELRRVRRQIRCIFGGMLSNLPDSSSLRVDELLSDRDDLEQMAPMAPALLAAPAPQAAPLAADAAAQPPAVQAPA